MRLCLERTLIWLISSKKHRKNGSPLSGLFVEVFHDNMAAPDSQIDAAATLTEIESLMQEPSVRMAASALTRADAAEVLYGPGPSTLHASRAATARRCTATCADSARARTWRVAMMPVRMRVHVRACGMRPGPARR